MPTDDPLNQQSNCIHSSPFVSLRSVVGQGNLWNRLLITKETWASLTTKHNVFPYFTESILKFGLQEDDDSNTWNNFHSRDPLNGSGDSELLRIILSIYPTKR